MATARRCQSWPKARPTSGNVGSMCETTGRTPLDANADAWAPRASIDVAELGAPISDGGPGKMRHVGRADFLGVAQGWSLACAVWSSPESTISHKRAHPRACRHYGRRATIPCVGRTCPQDRLAHVVRTLALWLVAMLVKLVFELCSRLLKGFPVGLTHNFYGRLSAHPRSGRQWPACAKARHLSSDICVAASRRFLLSVAVFHSMQLMACLLRHPVRRGPP
jgi:hypothetical protein